jgi:hypothetical protein
MEQSHSKWCGKGADLSNYGSGWSLYQSWAKGAVQKNSVLFNKVVPSGGLAKTLKLNMWSGITQLSK